MGLDPISLAITGVGITGLGAVIISALIRKSGASLPNRMWLGIIQRDVLEPLEEEGVTTDGTYALGSISGRRACVWLGEKGHLSRSVQATGLHKNPCDFRVQVQCVSPLEFTIFRMTSNHGKKLLPNDKHLPVSVNRKELIEIKQLGKPQLEQIAELQESGKVDVYSKNPAEFKQWQRHGEVGFLFNLLYMHSADGLSLCDQTLSYFVNEPNSYLLETDSVRSIVQDLHGLATDLEKNAPNK